MCEEQHHQGGIRTSGPNMFKMADKCTWSDRRPFLSRRWQMIRVLLQWNFYTALILCPSPTWRMSNRCLHLSGKVFLALRHRCLLCKWAWWSLLWKVLQCWCSVIPPGAPLAKSCSRMMRKQWKCVSFSVTGCITAGLSLFCFWSSINDSCEGHSHHLFSYDYICIYVYIESFI